VRWWPGSIVEELATFLMEQAWKKDRRDKVIKAWEDAASVAVSHATSGSCEEMEGFRANNGVRLNMGGITRQAIQTGVVAGDQ
jgi:hypothetical protein